MLRAEHLAKTYPTRNGDLVVLRDASFTLDRGHSMSLVGPSGSGKSTLLNILGTLETPTSGAMQLDSANPFELSRDDRARFRNQRVGFVFQDHHLLPQLSAIENVLVPTLVSENRASVAPRAEELLKRIGLADRLHHRPAELSGGERQRVALARALINKPLLLLADEPTGNLDRHTAETVADLLLELHQAEQNILVVVTHSETLAAKFSRQFELHDGQLVEHAHSAA